jgi:pyruvate formate lyase activating enzyme
MFTVGEMSSDLQRGTVFDIREFTIHDGPGLRTTVFCKGCPLRCAWCHNPEGLDRRPQLITTAAGSRMIGKGYSSKEVASILNDQASMLAIGEGGVTFSGGEPLAQSAFIAEVIDHLRGIHVVLDTSGYATDKEFRRVAERCQLVYFDLKLISPEMHLRFTGARNEPILRNLSTLSDLGIPFVIRIPLVPGVTDTTENLNSIAKTVCGLKGLIRVDALPYNRAAGGKYSSLGLEFHPPYDESATLNTDLSPFERLGIPARLAGRLVNC